jgi:hypothetical protein
MDVVVRPKPASGAETRGHLKGKLKRADLQVTVHNEHYRALFSGTLSTTVNDVIDAVQLLELREQLLELRQKRRLDHAPVPIWLRDSTGAS